MAEREVRAGRHAGFFNPNILIVREPGPGPRPAIVVAVDPGKRRP
jgi:hypothetical protein